MIPIRILPDGSVIKALPPNELADPVCIENARRGIGGYVDSCLGRLVYDELNEALVFQPGEFKRDPADKRDIPEEQKSDIFVEKGQ